MSGLQPFDPATLLLVALLNPAVALVGVMMGRAADQWQKLIVAAFVAALAGSALVWLGAYFRVLPARGIGGEAGLFAFQIVIGLGWAWLGYSFKSRR